MTDILEVYLTWQKDLEFSSYCISEYIVHWWLRYNFFIVGLVSLATPNREAMARVF